MLETAQCSDTPCGQYCSNKENLSVYGRARINRIERAIAHI